jgi:hypothetical protein
MSTRAQVRFATREDGVSFSEHPEKIHAQFYNHSDGYPEGLGVEIAESIMNPEPISGWEIESLTHKHGDLEYIYYIWQYPGKETWISIFEVGSFRHNCSECGTLLSVSDNQDKCIFVGLPTELINKYKQNTNNDG